MILLNDKFFKNPKWSFLNFSEPQNEEFRKYDQ